MLTEHIGYSTQQNPYFHLQPPPPLKSKPFQYVGYCFVYVGFEYAHTKTEIHFTQPITW